MPKDEISIKATISLRISRKRKERINLIVKKIINLTMALIFSPHFTVVVFGVALKKILNE